MTFSLSGFINGFTGSKKVNKVLLSPVWLAVVIILVLTIILYFILKSHIDDGLYSVLAKQAIYTLLVTMGILFLHDQAITQQFEQENRDKRKDEIIERAIPGETLIQGAAKPVLSNPVVGSSSNGIIEEPDTYTTTTPDPPPEPPKLEMSPDGTIGGDYFV